MKRMLPCVLAVLYPGLGEAKCIVSGPKWYLHTNDRVDISVKSDSDGCGHSFGRGFAWQMDKVAVMQQPKNGTMRQIGETTFYYIPKRGYVGPDNYVIYICGKDTWGLGCSRLNFNVSVIDRRSFADQLASGGTRTTGSSCQMVQSPCGMR